MSPADVMSMTQEAMFVSSRSVSGMSISWNFSSHYILFTQGTATVLGQKEHKTPQAAEKANDLSCYVCDSMDVGSACTDLPNNMSFITKCQDDRRTCMVKQFSYSTTATGTSPDNSSWPFRRPWSLQRNCTNKCEPGCIIIGERTKLYACTACCEKSLCNNMKAVATQHGYSTLTILSVAILAFASS